MLKGFVDRLRQLIAAGSGLIASGVSFQNVCDLSCVLSLDQLGDGLQIAVAAAEKNNIGKLSVFEVEGNIDGTGAFHIVRIPNAKLLSIHVKSDIALLYLTGYFRSTDLL